MEGYFKNHKMNGHARIVLPDGIEQEGTWKDGKFEG